MKPRTKPRRELFPERKPYRSGFLKVSKLHTIHFEECGNPRGKPVLIVHGGPGGGCNATMRRYHDPARYRIVLFDQRGCGRSMPRCSRSFSMSATRFHVVFSRSSENGLLFPQPRWLCSTTRHFLGSK